MDTVFAQGLADWSAFYTLIGGAAATLLGLLFVAVSLRLNIFRQREVADVRDFAALSFGSFLVAIVIAALILAPHGERMPLTLALALIGVGGLCAVAWTAREWIRLNAPTADDNRPGFASIQWQGWAYWVGMGAAYAGLIVVAVLVRRGEPGALGWLALVEGWLLALGTMSAWVLLSHAGGDSDDAT